MKRSKKAQAAANMIIGGLPDGSVFWNESGGALVLCGDDGMIVSVTPDGSTSSANVAEWETGYDN